MQYAYAQDCNSAQAFGGNIYDGRIEPAVGMLPGEQANSG
jgi:hypothetical protein